MRDDEPEAAIAAQPFEKVSKVEIDRRIKSTEYHILPNSTVSICNITLDNGFSVRGESACVDPRNFNLEIGRQIAYRNAFDKLWQLMGFLLCEKRFLAEKMKGQVA